MSSDGDNIVKIFQNSVKVIEWKIWVGSRQLKVVFIFISTCQNVVVAWNGNCWLSLFLASFDRCRWFSVVFERVNKSTCIIDFYLFFNSICHDWYLTPFLCRRKNNSSLHFHYQGLVIAGIKDLQRPADQLSIGQSASLAATGLIWSRYSLVIIPKNYGLFTGNLSVVKLQFCSHSTWNRLWLLTDWMNFYFIVCS